MGTAEGDAAATTKGDLVRALAAVVVVVVGTPERRKSPMCPVLVCP